LIASSRRGDAAETGTVMNSTIRSAALAAIVVAASFASPANAQIAPAPPGATDPTVLHVGADATGGPGTSPNVILNGGTEFFVANVSGQDVASPIDLFFAVPNGDAAPTITSVNCGTSFTGPTDLMKSFTSSSSPSDFYGFLGV